MDRGGQVGRRGRRLGDHGLGGATALAQILLHREQGLDLLLGELDRGLDLGLGQLVGTALDHDHLLGVGGDDQVQVGLGVLVNRRVHDELPVNPAHAHGGHRAGERGGGQVHRGGRGVQRDDVGVIGPVGAQDQDIHLDFATEGLGEQGTQGPVGHAAGQRLLVLLLALTLEEAARDLAGGVGALAVVDHQGEEVLPLDVLAGHDAGGQDDRLAVLRNDGAVGLRGPVAGVKGQGSARKRDLNLLCHGVLCLLRTVRCVVAPPARVNAGKGSGSPVRYLRRPSFSISAR